MKTIVLAAAAALALTAGPVLAETAATRSVATHDLDLTTAAGQARLDARIENAVRSLCRSGDRGLAARRSEQACEAQIRSGARLAAVRSIASARGQRVAALSAIPGA